jgi:8-oxo-dGTP diphosphatase
MPRQRKTFSASVFIVLTSGNRICFLKRNATGWMDGHYSIPAGAVEAGETLAQAVVREALEEIGVRLRLDSLRHVHVLHCLTDGEPWFGHFFAAGSWDGDPKICEPEKHRNLTWATFEDAPRPMVPYVESALTAVKAGAAYSSYGWPVREGS